MKNFKIILFISAFLIALASAFASNAIEMPAPFFGVSISGQCVMGVIESTICSPTVQPRRCTVALPDASLAIAFDDISGTTCIIPVYRP